MLYYIDVDIPSEWFKVEKGNNKFEISFCKIPAYFGFGFIVLSNS